MDGYTIFLILVLLGVPTLVAFLAKEKGKDWRLWFAIGLVFNIVAFWFLKDDEASDYQ